MSTLRCFIGSSSEALPAVRILESILSALEVETCPWTESFNSGRYVIEELESVCKSVSAAAFLIAPDDVSEYRGERVAVTRQNVILEWGFLASALGRERILLLVDDSAFVHQAQSPESLRLAVPSDLHGLTVVPCKFTRTKRNRLTIVPNNMLKEAVTRWVKGLNSKHPGLAGLSPLLPLSGHWSIRGSYSLWRTKQVAADEVSAFTGEAVLYMERGGKTAGFVTGEMQIVDAQGNQIVRKILDRISDTSYSGNKFVLTGDLVWLQVTRGADPAMPALQNPDALTSRTRHKHYWRLEAVSQSELQGTFENWIGKTLWTKADFVWERT